MDGKAVRQLAVAIIAAAVVAIGYAAWRKSGASGGGKVVPWAGAVIDWGAPAKNGCDIGWMSAVLPHPHPIYRQTMTGVTRDGLSRYGWAWIADPPSEQGLGYE
jgi:hypothetical protein